MGKVGTTVIAACAAAVLIHASAYAQELAKTHVKVVGTWGNVTQYTQMEAPFWTKEIPEKSGGAITAEITPFNEMGLKGPEIFRLMRLGVIDFGATVLGYVAGDDARNEAIDLAGLTPDLEMNRKIADAYKPVYDKFYTEKFGLKVLGIWPYPGQVVFCNTKINSLADLKGKKIRTANRSLAELAEALGATSVSLAFNEVVPALQNKVIDCAVSGTLTANQAKWFEVATDLYALPLGWSPIMFAVNKKRWDGLSPAVRDFLTKEIAGYEDRIWKAMAEETQQGIDCNIGKDSCRIGVKGNMRLVTPSEADLAELRKVVSDVVVAKWAERCPGDCVPEWNKTVGKTLGIEAKAN